MRYTAATYLLIIVIIIILILAIVPIRDGFHSGTSATVDLPLTQSVSCKNFCGPLSRCAITGQQCFYDSDCPGCQGLNKQKNYTFGPEVPAANDAGKLSYYTPQYSPLTTDLGTFAGTYSQQDTTVPKANFGPSLWRNSYDYGMKLFDKRYKAHLSDEPKYQRILSATGEFVDNGPLPANYN